jgi:peptidyl-prolyl cis-trans isomerase C
VSHAELTKDRAPRPRRQREITTMRSFIASGLMAGIAAGFIVAPGFAQDQPANQAAPADAVAPASADAAPKTYDADTVLATVNGTPITLGSVIALSQTLPPQYQELPDAVLLKGLVDQMVDQQVLADMQSSSPDQDPLAVKLAVENQRRSVLAGLAAQAAVASAATEDAVRAAYDKMVADFKPATEWNAAHILVDSEDKAKELKAEIDGGADFAEVAKANSSDGSAASGGDLGWFGTGQMVPEFETAVKGLEKGQVSDPVKSQFGWHLVKLVDSRETAAPSLEQARPQIEDQLRQEALQAKITELKASAEIEVPEGVVPPAAIRDGNLLTN